MKSSTDSNEKKQYIWKKQYNIQILNIWFVIKLLLIAT